MPVTIIKRVVLLVLQPRLVGWLGRILPTHPSSILGVSLPHIDSFGTSCSCHLIRTGSRCALARRSCRSNRCSDHSFWFNGSIAHILGKVAIFTRFPGHSTVLCSCMMLMLMGTTHILCGHNMKWSCQSTTCILLQHYSLTTSASLCHHFLAGCREVDRS